MAEQFGHHTQERTYKVLMQYKEKQLGLLKMITFSVTTILETFGRK